jgi:hypothetical protein
MVLKGPVLAELLYEEVALRPYTDIDILVPADQSCEADRIFRDLGYVVEEDHGGLTAPHADTNEHAFEMLYIRAEPPARLDVHFDHLQIGLRPNELPELWERSEPWKYQKARARVPAVGDLFLLLAVHLHRHGFSRLIWFKDLDLLIRRFGNQIDWESLGRRAASEGVSLSLNLALQRVAALLGTDLPQNARQLAGRTPVSFVSSLLWNETDALRIDARGGQWRRAVQFVPRDGVRGVVPSLLLMGRRLEKIRALQRRWRSKGRHGRAI